MKISRRAENITPFYVMEVAKAASELGARVAHTDAPMVFLNIGEPDFTAPPLVQEAALRATRLEACAAASTGARACEKCRVHGCSLPSS